MVTREELAPLLAGVDILFLPSQFEGIALVLFESMAAGVPVVAADVGGQSELVTPETGILVARGTEVEESVAYADALERLLTDEGLRRGMGYAGRQRVEKEFPLDRLGERFVKLVAKAGHLAETAPRSVTPDGLARASATEAVELTRLKDLMMPAIRRARPAATQNLYLYLQRNARPSYLWCVGHGMPWLPRLRDALKSVLLGD